MTNRVTQSLTVDGEHFTLFAASREGRPLLKADGTVACWGDVYDGHLPDPETFLQIDAGQDNYCGVKTDSTIGCWGAQVR
jgi:hypothetical protein